MRKRNRTNSDGTAVVSRMDRIAMGSILPLTWSINATTPEMKGHWEREKEPEQKRKKKKVPRRSNQLMAQK